MFLFCRVFLEYAYYFISHFKIPFAQMWASFNSYIVPSLSLMHTRIQFPQIGKLANKGATWQIGYSINKAF